jgi:hypothetical protein
MAQLTCDFIWIFFFSIHKYNNVCGICRNYKDMSSVITVESELSAVAISSLLKGLDYFEYKYIDSGLTIGPHVIGLKRKQNSPGFRKVGMNIIIYSVTLQYLFLNVYYIFF